MATGWGKEKDSPAVTSPVLRYMSTSVIPNSLCDRFYGLIGDGHICTASTRKTSTCNGDSGGPLVAHDVQVRIYLCFVTKECFSNLYVAGRYYIVRINVRVREWISVCVHQSEQLFRLDTGT